MISNYYYSSLQYTGSLLRVKGNCLSTLFVMSVYLNLVMFNADINYGITVSTIMGFLFAV